MGIRDQVVDYLEYWQSLTGISLRQLVRHLGIHRSKFYQWRERKGIETKHNGQVPRDFWITEEEKRAVIDFYRKNKSEGYCAATYMMIDQDIAYMSSSSVYRILANSGLIRTKNSNSSKKGSGFEQPLHIHEHWHTDISYLKIDKRFYFFFGVLDGCSRAILHWEIRENMTEQDVEVVLQRAVEKHPEAKPRLITDNGSQYTAQEFKKFVAQHGLTHVRTACYYPQSNGKMERFHHTLKSEGIKPSSPLNVDDARRITEKYVDYYNNERLHSAIVFVAPMDKLKGRDAAIFEERKEKLKTARKKRLEQFAKTG